MSKNRIKIVEHTTGGIKNFIKEQCDDLISENQSKIKVLVLDYKIRWYFHIHWFIKKLNNLLSKHNYYAQYGVTVGLDKLYFIVIINVLSDLNTAHLSLANTEYYKFWDKKHYTDVVLRRNEY